MKEREFNKILNGCRIRGRLDTAKLEAIPDDVRGDMVRLIVRNRQPVLASLIPARFDTAWLECMGYLYRTKGKEFTFVHTCEHQIK